MIEAALSVNDRPIPKAKNPMDMKVKSGPNNDKKQHGEKKKFPPLSKKGSKKQRKDIALMTVHKNMNSSSNETDAKYLKEENMKLKEQRMCKRLYTPLCPSVGRSVTFNFFYQFCFFK